MSMLLVFLAIAMPWVIGAAVTASLLPRGRPGAGLLSLGLGYCVGMLLVASILLSQHALDISLHVPWIGLSAAVLPAAFLILRKAHLERQTCLRSWKPLSTLLIILALATFAITIVDAYLRPIFSWDAWLLYSYRAHLFAYYQQIVEIVSLRTWLAQPEQMAFSASAKHPHLVSLIQAWPNLANGHWSEASAAISWPLAGLATFFIISGFAQHLGLKQAHSLALGLMAYSVPTILIQSTLAGYADLWLALLLLAGTSSVVIALQGHHYRTLILGILFFTGCLMAKQNAAPFVGVALAACTAFCLPRRLCQVYSVLVVIGTIAVFFMLENAESLPWTIEIFGKVYGLEDGRLTIPMMPSVLLTESNGSLSALALAWLYEEHFSVFGWIFLALLAQAAWRPFWSNERVAFFLWIFLAAASLIMLFGYTSRGPWLEVGTAHVRILMVFMLSTILFALLGFTNPRLQRTPYGNNWPAPQAASVNLQKASMQACFLETK